MKTLEHKLCIKFGVELNEGVWCIKAAIPELNEAVWCIMAAIPELNKDVWCIVTVIPSKPKKENFFCKLHYLGGPWRILPRWPC